MYTAEIDLSQPIKLKIFRADIFPACLPNKIKLKTSKKNCQPLNCALNFCAFKIVKSLHLFCRLHLGLSNEKQPRSKKRAIFQISYKTVCLI